MIVEYCNQGCLRNYLIKRKKSFQNVPLGIEDEGGVGGGGLVERKKGGDGGGGKEGGGGGGGERVVVKRGKGVEGGWCW